MSRKIIGASPSGTLYARVLNPSGLWWNGTTFEAYTEGNYADYDIAMTEQGTSTVYVADFPTAITTGGTYQYFVHRQAGASPAAGDPVINTGKIDWTGAASISAASGAMSGSEFRDYIVEDKGVIRTDKDQQIYAATTDAIQEMRRRFMFDEAETEATMTDTIATLGEFKLDVESDLGLLQGVVLEDDDTGTQLDKVSKSKFDELYPSINVDTDRGYPRHYCVYAGQIYIGPAPDSTDYSYRMSYSRRAGTITSSTTGVPFTNLYRDVLAELVLAHFYDALGEKEEGMDHRGKFEAGFALCVRRERQNSGVGTFNMRPTNF